MSEKILQLREETTVCNKLKVVGYLKAKKIEEGKDKNSKPYIKGTLTVATSDAQNVDVDFYFNKFKVDSEEVSKLYEDAQKLKDYVSIVDLIEKKEAKDEEEAKGLCDVVDIQGSINPNEYLDDTDTLVSRPKLNGTFFHRVDKGKVKYDDFGAFWEADIYFESIKPEHKNRLETGRAVVEGIVATKIKPAKVGAMTFYAQEEDKIAEYLLDNYQKELTGRVNGEFRITKQEVQSTGGFGTKSKVDSGSVSFEWIITGGEEKQYREESKYAYDVEVIKKALEERLTEATKAKANKKNKQRTGSTGFGKSSGSSLSNKTAQDIENKFSDDDF